MSKLSFSCGLFVLLAIGMVACGDNDKNADADLPEDQIHLAKNALKSLSVTEGLEVQLVAAEPLIKNPTNIDVDDRGRIWVTEGFNYRGTATTIPEGDRIVILIDLDQDGQADTTKVFYQGPEINTPLGICVVGDNRVIVSQSPYVWIFHDDNGDDSADRKEILFQGIEGVQHDHGMHSFTSGPDGKLYFNFGNEARTLRDKNNQPVLDQFGDSIGHPKYKQGMVFRCDPDGSNIERLGHNFRNNYEVAVDSYGLMWQSDNDDDGNRGVRINYVMDYGNYGYTDEITGAWWTENRINREDSVPFRHWHLNDPGSVPNLLQTGSGSPTGMVIYEGELLPERFRNQIIHCEPGHNVVRAYPVSKDGAGYTAEIENILSGEKDQWFRPSDVCVAPDGSLIVADWYDPVVGGHDARDKESGRVYRIAPKKTAYRQPEIDYATAEGAVKALQNPNLVVRRKAWMAIQKMGNAAIPELEKVWNSSSNSRMRARALWALSALPGGEKYITRAAGDQDADIRITAVRAARENPSQLPALIKELVKDADPQVRREVALSLHKNKMTGSSAIWNELADKYDGKDRWYLEALGIGADGQWDEFFAGYVSRNPDPAKNEAGKDLVWRARTDLSLPYLKKLATDSSVDLKSRLRYLRAFHFNGSPQKSATLLEIINENRNNHELNAVVLQALDKAVINRSSVAKQALDDVLRSVYGTPTYIDLTRQYDVASQVPQLIRLSLEKSGEQIAADAIKLVIHHKQKQKLYDIIYGKDRDKAIRMIRAFGMVGYTETLSELQKILTGKQYADTLRYTAAHAIGRTYGGEETVFQLIKEKKVPADLMAPLMEGLEHGPRRSHFLKVQDYLAAQSGNPRKSTFDRDSVMSLSGNSVAGKEVFANNCSVCHNVNGQGIDFGPNLTEIGGKLPKEGLLDAIANPSAGISFGYETNVLKLKNGTERTGLISMKSENEIELKYPGGTKEKFNLKDIATISKKGESLMPALQESMSSQQFADLLSYLSTLEKK